MTPGVFLHCPARAAPVQWPGSPRAPSSPGAGPWPGSRCDQSAPGAGPSPGAASLRLSRAGSWAGSGSALAACLKRCCRTAPFGESRAARLQPEPRSERRRLLTSALLQTNNKWKKKKTLLCPSQSLGCTSSPAEQLSVQRLEATENFRVPVRDRAAPGAFSAPQLVPRRAEMCSSRLVEGPADPPGWKSPALARSEGICVL